MTDNEIRGIDFTEAAWESLYDTVDDEDFTNEDAQVIYDSLQNRLKFISFGDYLKRYIYVKAELDGEYDEIPIKEYQSIIKESFADNHTPVSFVPTTSKLSSLSKNWLTQQTVKRNAVFILGFGLNMSVNDVNLFLTKALREPEINPKSPFEVICWYCYKYRYNFFVFEKLWAKYNEIESGLYDENTLFGEKTISVRNTMYTIYDEETLMEHLSKLKTSDNVARISVTAKEQFDLLYNEARDLVADLYNQINEEKYGKDLLEYKQKLGRNDKLYDYEKLERIEKFADKKQIYTRNDITESDIEHIICSAIPKDRHGNLTPGKASKLNEQFAGKRFSRQHIGEIFAGKAEINRFDLITLNFFIFAQKADTFRNEKQRFMDFLDSTNEILEKCFMGKFYIQNPYECFLLMCMLSDDPLGTYADVWELSYEKQDADKN